MHCYTHCAFEQKKTLELSLKRVISLSSKRFKEIPEFLEEIALHPKRSFKS